MKARNVAERRRFKKLAQGRPRDAMAKRDPSGRISRPNHSERERDVTAVVVKQRMDHFNLTAEQARSDLAGDVLGRLLLGDMKRRRALITRDAHDAGRAYQRLAYEVSKMRSQTVRFQLPDGSPLEIKGPPDLSACPIEPRTKGHSVAMDLPHDRRLRYDWAEADVRFKRADPAVRVIVDRVLLSDLNPCCDEAVWKVFVRGMGIVMDLFQMDGPVEPKAAS